jgi:glycosyltransferase involved in cell wall biosynthesis
VTSSASGSPASDPAAAARDPYVSVIIPVYNVAALVPDALDSVLAQTFVDYEIIVVNDGSPDTAELEAALMPYRDRIEYVVQANRGPSGARNTGVRRARGEFVAFLDADDTFLPHFLAEHVSRARLDPAADVFYGDLLIFGDVPEAGRTVMEFNPSSGPVDFASLVTHRCNPLLCSIVRRRTLLAHGLFDETYRRSEDFDLWLRFAHAGVRFNYTHEVVGRYCVRPGGLSADTVLMYQGVRDVLEKCQRTLDLDDAERNVLALQLRRTIALQRLHEGRRAFVAGDYASARAALRDSNVELRSRKLAIASFLLRVAPGLAAWAYRVRDALLGREAPVRF